MTKEERDLWDRYRKEGDDQAREALVLRYLPQVDFWVSRWKQRLFWVTKEDLRQSGTIGLIKAVDRFDPDWGTEFSTYSRWWIRAEIFSSPDVTRDVPKQQRQYFRKIRGAHDALMQPFGPVPTTQEIAAHARLTPKQVEDALTASAVGFPEELLDVDVDAQAGAYEFLDPAKKHALDELTITFSTFARSAQVNNAQINSEFLDAENTDTLERLTEALARLPDRSRTVLMLSFWGGKLDEEIGTMLLLKPNHIKQIRFRSLDSLSALFGVQREKNSAKQQKGQYHGA
jgi:RNA polymerase sigma factor (sigma-70 family)